MSLPSLTVVLVTQNAQNRIPRVLDALAKQTVAAELEVFIVYIAPAHPAPVSPDGLRVIPVDQSNIINMGQARAAGDACRSGWARPFLLTLPVQVMGHGMWALGESCGALAAAFTRILSSGEK